ncbi:MAG TPA: phage terminase large subunit [Acidisphaera sp.]|nr:phage terminase large subunit [Acidisphaera sp.]
MAIRESLTTWAEHALHDEQWTLAAHHKLLIGKLEAVAAGKIDRLMVLMPPGSAKSTYTSIVFPPWWLANNPRSSIIFASHTADFAARFGHRARDLVRNNPELGYRILSDENAAGRWRTTHGSDYFAVGVKGPIIGRRADLVLIDDPIRSFMEADSPKARDRLWDWYRSDLMTRLRPRARIVLIMTRWHEDDLGGRLLAHEPDQWELLRLPAIAGANDPLGRKPGDPLWPQWETAEHLARKQATVGSRVWFAHYQQDPRPAEGSTFDVRRIDILDSYDPPQGSVIVRAWDLAATPDSAGGNPDWSAGVKLVRHAPSGRIVVLDVVRFRGSPLTVEETLLKIADADGRDIVIGLAQDPGSAGKAYVAMLTARLFKYQVVTSPETGSKQQRANLVAAQIEAGNLAIVRGHWNAAFTDELKAFPHGVKDDQVDALSRAYAMMTVERPAVRAREVTFTHTAR